jgi:sulfite reductase (NADPH) flavoprotein alpha-component
VLGFGDWHFARYRQFAVGVEVALVARGWRMLLPSIKIDRQSAQDFVAWGREVAVTLGLNLALEHKAAIPRGWRRKFYSRLPRFEAVTWSASSPGSDLPRIYSLASFSRDSVLELGVRTQPSALCSAHLYSLQSGDTIQAFITPNPEYRPEPGRAPVLLIGAGRGIGPLAGLFRDNPASGPCIAISGRDPRSDFLYERELRDWLADGSLSRLTAAFSRVNGHDYIQDRIRADAQAARDAIASGGQVMVCGLAAMAAAVAEEVGERLSPRPRWSGAEVRWKVSRRCLLRP